ncbi:zinc ribbon domain-containing protein [Lactobacillus sp. PV034]|uniref:zinc ribbon domain-containing protein n=1 Tax=Lactobacillus sp. PV034 TaxID=2594495 RepID=UPI00223F0F12|nr:zinc ribbon domain-containing protein [Lactobacillus sp. PV034]QNQ80203.1 zinc ribbon domain-containing protein [Lactobacillus sp. PV034]
MKICPNCQAQVEDDVKFCTHCGYKFANNAANQAVQTVVNNQPPVSPNYNQATNVNPQPQPQSQPAQPQSQITNQISNAVHNFDAHNLWQWFVDSWKHPLGEQKAPKWYGIVTFIVEDILFALGSMLIANAAMSSATFGMFSGNSDTNGAFIQVFLFLILLTLGSILASFIASKFVYSQTIGFWDYVNRIAQIDNLSAIFMIVAFIGALIKSDGLFAFLVILAGIFFELAVFVPVLADKNAKRDKFYGLIIGVVIQLIIAGILFSVFKQSIQSQLQNSVLHLF